jgi:hypothetical protein
VATGSVYTINGIVFSFFDAYYWSAEYDVPLSFESLTRFAKVLGLNKSSPDNLVGC